MCALHVLQTLVRGAGLGGALLRHATPMVTLALRGLGSPCWAMRNAAIQLFSEYRGGEIPAEPMQSPEVRSLAGAKCGGLGRGWTGPDGAFCPVPAGALTSRLLGQQRSRGEGCPAEGVSLQAFLGQHPQLGAVLLGELAAAAGPTPGGPHLRPALHAILTLLAQLQPGADSPGR